MARRHFESGVAYLQESDYESALRAFEKAYELSKRPEIQLNIATVHERQGRLTDAIASLERYLSEAPDGEHIETVKLRISNLRKRLETEPGAPGTEAPKPEPAPAPPPAATPPPAAPAPAPPAAAPAARPEPNRIPAYVAFGVGGVAAAGAVLTGIFAKAEYDNAETECQQACSDDELSTGRTLAVTSTVLTGVAIVGAALGVTLWLTTDSGEEQVRGPSPRVFVGLRDGQPSAAASWRF
jgi:tetratricopeptide (TPR) repeat protein